MVVSKQAGGGGWTDNDIMFDVLRTSKWQTKFYAQGATEATNPGVREVFLAFHGEEQHNEEVLFNFLQVRGLYQPAEVDKKQLQQAIQHAQKVHQEMGLPAPQPRRYETADPTMPPAEPLQPQAYDYKGDTLSH
jgi:spore coat protein CotF